MWWRRYVAGTPSVSTCWSCCSTSSFARSWWTRSVPSSLTTNNCYTGNIINVAGCIYCRSRRTPPLLQHSHRYLRYHRNDHRVVLHVDNNSCCKWSPGGRWCSESRCKWSPGVAVIHVASDHQVVQWFTLQVITRWCSDSRCKWSPGVAVIHVASDHQVVRWFMLQVITTWCSDSRCKWSPDGAVIHVTSDHQVVQWFMLQLITRWCSDSCCKWSPGVVQRCSVTVLQWHKKHNF